MTIAAFEGFYGGSHKSWLDGLMKHSSHEIIPFTLPDRFWKWRMRGGAVTLARRFREKRVEPDCLLVTDMLDVPLLLSLLGKGINYPVVLYMHENQLTYPWSPTDPDPEKGRDHHYAFINYISCLAADRVLFNSRFHMHAFLDALPGFLGMFPDHRETGNVDVIRAKSQVIPLGLDLLAFDAHPAERDPHRKTVLWNHRWEYDKDPDSFFKAMFALSEEGRDFGLIVCGESTDTIPDIFTQAREILRKHIVHWGTVTSFAEYATLLRRSDILPVTSRQDFFGISAVEAIYCGVFPVLPNRQAFPEHIPAEFREDVFYEGGDELISKLRAVLSSEVPCRQFDGKTIVRKYDWSEVIHHYDDYFESLA